MDQKFLNKIKKSLEEEKRHLEKDLGSFAKKNIHNKNDYKTKFVDIGSDSDENAKEVAQFEERISIEHTLEKELRDINNSLKKIKQGTYGICKYCQKEISEKRLLARPTSSTCIKCKKKFKKEK